MPDFDPGRRMTSAGAPRPSLCEHGRGIEQHASSLLREVLGTVRDGQVIVAEHLCRQPYRTIAVAGGVGYVLGGGLNLRIARLVATLAVRFATAVAVRELGARILPPGQNSQPTRAVCNETAPYREKP